MIWLGLARIAQALIGLAALRLSTHYLTVEQFGLLGLLTGITTCFGLLLINPLGQHVNRHTHEWHKQHVLLYRLRQYNHYLLGLAVAVFVVSTCWFANRLISPQDSLTILAVGITISTMIWVSTWNATLVPLLSMLGLPLQSAGLALLTAAVSLLCSVTVVQWQQAAHLWLIGQMLGSLVGAVWARQQLKKLQQTERHSPPDSVFITHRQIVDYCLPISASTSLMWLLTGGYRFYVDQVWGVHALGLLIVGFAVAGQFWGIIETICAQAIYPKYYLALSKNDRHLSAQAFNQMLSILIPSYILMLCFALAISSRLIPLLADSRYASAAQFCQIAMIFEFLRVLTNTIMQASQIAKKTASMMYPYLFACLVGLVGLIVLRETGGSALLLPWVLLAAWGSALLCSLTKVQSLATISLRWHTLGYALLSGGTLFIAGQTFQPGKNITYDLAFMFACGIFTIISIFLIQRNNSKYHELMKIKLPAE